MSAKLIPFRSTNKKLLAGVKFFITKTPTWSGQTTITYSNMNFRRWLEPFGGELTDKPQEANVLLFTGGADISPSLYFQPAHTQTYATAEARDRMEMAYFLMNKDKLKVGICRGAQLLNVLSGGSLIQHIGNHSHRSDHDVIDVRNGTILEGVCSTHHQMMLPSKKVADREIVLCAYEDKVKPRFSLCHSFRDKEVPKPMLAQQKNFLKSYRAKDFNPLTQDLEMVYYYSTKSLCIQGHPEGGRSSPGFGKFTATAIAEALETTKGDT